MVLIYIVDGSDIYSCCVRYMKLMSLIYIVIFLCSEFFILLVVTPPEHLNEILNEIKQLKLDSLKGRVVPLGTTSSAKYKQILEDENLYQYSLIFHNEICRIVNDFKKRHAVGDFHVMEDINYPTVPCSEASVQKDRSCFEERIGNLTKNRSTHDFVTACMVALTTRKCVVNLANGQEIPVELTSFPGIFRQDCPSFLNRKPDLPFYSKADSYDSYNIKWLVEVKKRSHGEFNDDQIGQILDMTVSLLSYQHEERMGIVSCLTDGYRFKFFQVTRELYSTNIIVHHSAMFEGDPGCQVRS